MQAIPLSRVGMCVGARQLGAAVILLIAQMVVWQLLRSDVISRLTLVDKTWQHLLRQRARQKRKLNSRKKLICFGLSRCY